LGHMLFVRDVPSFNFHGQPDSYLPPQTRVSDCNPVVWYDDPDTEEDAITNVETKVMNQDQYDMIYRKMLDPEQVIGETSKLNIFFVKKAASDSPGYVKLLEYVRLTGDFVFKQMTFAFIVDDDATPEAVKLAQDLSKLLIDHGASGCFYKPKGTMMEELYKNHDIQTIFGKILKVVPDRGLSIELPSIESGECPKEWDRFDSVVVEDTQHCSSEIALHYPSLAPTPFDSRQSKNREMVIFNSYRAYTQYAVLVYQYESEESMKENMGHEYPLDRHGIPLGENGDPLPLFFFGDSERRTEPVRPSVRPSACPDPSPGIINIDSTPALITPDSSFIRTDSSSGITSTGSLSNSSTTSPDSSLRSTASSPDSPITITNPCSQDHQCFSVSDCSSAIVLDDFAECFPLKHL